MNHKTTLYMVKLLFLLTKMLNGQGGQNECVNFAELNCTILTILSNFHEESPIFPKIMMYNIAFRPVKKFLKSFEVKGFFKNWANC